MSTPATALDQRYSAPEATAVGWDETVQILRSAELFWITTVRADGRPHVTPLVAVWLDDAIHFHTGAGEQKFRNLQANPYVVLTTGRDSWDSGIDVVVEGKAVAQTDRDTLGRLAQAWATKWDGRWRLEAGDGGFRNPDMDNFTSRVFTVVPTRVYAHAKGDPFGATTYRF